MLSDVVRKILPYGIQNLKIIMQIFAAIISHLLINESGGGTRYIDVAIGST